MARYQKYSFWGTPPSRRLFGRQKGYFVMLIVTKTIWEQPVVTIVVTVVVAVVAVTAAGLL